MNKIAKKGYSPAADGSGDWGSDNPVSDGKNYNGKFSGELRNNGFSNIGGNDVYPSLSNPYIAKGADYKIKGEKEIDSDTDQLAHSGGNDTWPELKNVYVPSSVQPKMKSDNLLVDK